jgi:hypothetical protein
MAAGKIQRAGGDPDTDPDFIVQQAQRRISTAHALYEQAIREAGQDNDAAAEAAHHYAAIKQQTLEGVPQELWPRLKY